MDPKSALAVWDRWVAAQHFEANRSVPDRKMLEALLDCESPAMQVTLRTGLTVGEVALELKKIHYP